MQTSIIRQEVSSTYFILEGQGLSNVDHFTYFGIWVAKSGSTALEVGTRTPDFSSGVRWTEALAAPI